MHGSDLFKALIDLSNDRGPENIAVFMRFVWLRCHHKMKHRLKADEVLLLHTILMEWNIEDADVVEETYFRVHQCLYYFFDSLGIPFQVTEETTKREYEFSRSTVPAWCSLFVKVLADVKEKAETCDMQPGTIDKLNEWFFRLDSLLHHNKAFQTIRSLYNRVCNAMSNTVEDRRKGELQKELLVVSVSF